MNYAWTTYYNAGLLQRASRRFVFVKLKYILMFGGPLTIAFIATAIAVPSLEVTNLAFFLTLFYVFLFLFTHLKQKKAAADQMKNLADGKVEVKLNEETFAVKSAAGQSEHKWTVVRALYIFEEYWILELSSRMGLIIPLQDIPAGAEEAIRAKLVSVGAKVK